MKAAIIGGSGFTGSELLRLLSNHPQIELVAITSETYAGKAISEIYANLLGVGQDLVFSKLNVKSLAEEADLVFTALPHGKPMTIIPELLDGECRVIDLSGDFRLAQDVYEAWYKIPHKSPHLINKAVYGLTELCGDELKDAELVSNPGCYPTSAILGIAPLLSAKMIFPQDIIVDSLTGVSGAGRRSTEETHYCHCNENVSSYKVGGIHQHIPEMEKTLGQIAGEEVKISFTPHLAPFSRGIYSTIYADLVEDRTVDELRELYIDYYSSSIFVEVLKKGVFPEVKSVMGSNSCHIGISIDDRCGRVIAIAAIDNLIKGAAGQAIQNMNIMFDFPESEGLSMAGIYP